MAVMDVAAVCGINEIVIVRINGKCMLLIYIFMLLTCAIDRDRIDRGLVQC